MYNDPSLDHANINVYTQNFDKIHPLVLMILNGNLILTSIKGYNSVTKVEI